MSDEQHTLDEPHVLIYTGRECAAIADAITLAIAVLIERDGRRESIRTLRGLQNRMLAEAAR